MKNMFSERKKVEKDGELTGTIAINVPMPLNVKICIWYTIHIIYNKQLNNQINK